MQKIETVAESYTQLEKERRVVIVVRTEMTLRIFEKADQSRSRIEVEKNIYKIRDRQSSFTG